MESMQRGYLLEWCHYSMRTSKTLDFVQTDPGSDARELLRAARGLGVSVKKLEHELRYQKIDEVTRYIHESKYDRMEVVSMFENNCWGRLANKLDQVDVQTAPGSRHFTCIMAMVKTLLGSLDRTGAQPAKSKRE